MNLGEQYNAAVAAKKNDPKNFIWKGPKEVINGETKQVEYRLMDCSKEQLLQFYNYCNSMLYNEQPPGRAVLKELIKKQRELCNAELFKRWIIQTHEIAPFEFLNSIKEFINKNELNPKELTVGNVIKDECPMEFTSISIDLVYEAFLSKLGKFDKSHITLRFLLDRGLWLSQKEAKSLIVDGDTRDKTEIIIERLNLKPGTTFKFTSKGLSYKELRAMTTLRSKKYSELTTHQLELLRDRILFELEDDVDFHIKQWQTRKNQIEQILEIKGFTADLL